MTTFKSKFHELGNWHNKISLASIVLKEMLLQKDLATMTKEELADITQKAIDILEKIEKSAIGADHVVQIIKPLIYQRIGADAEVF